MCYEVTVFHGQKALICQAWQAGQYHLSGPWIPSIDLQRTYEDNVDAIQYFSLTFSSHSTLHVNACITYVQRNGRCVLKDCRLHYLCTTKWQMCAQGLSNLDHMLTTRSLLREHYLWQLGYQWPVKYLNFIKKATILRNQKQVLFLQAIAFDRCTAWKGTWCKCGLLFKLLWCHMQPLHINWWFLSQELCAF